MNFMINKKGQLAPDVPSNYEDAEKVFRSMFDIVLSEYYFCLPCRVVAVSASTQTVDIQPVLKRYYIKAGQSLSRAVIKGVPFMFQRADDTYISLPIKVGDTGLAVFSQRDISNWKEVGGEVPLQSLRTSDYNDAIFLPFVGSKAQAIPDYNPDYIEIVKNGKKITVKDGVLDAPVWHINCKSITASETIHAGGMIDSDTDCVSAGISGKLHVHGGVVPGSGNTSTPQ